MVVDYYPISFAQRRMRMAAATNNIELMTELLRNGVSPNCFDDQGRTPLHHAVCRYNLNDNSKHTFIYF